MGKRRRRGGEASNEEVDWEREAWAKGRAGGSGAYPERVASKREAETVAVLVRAARRDEPANRLVPMRGAGAIKPWGSGLVRAAGTVKGLLGQKAGQGTQRGQDLSAVGLTDLASIFVVGPAASGAGR